MRTLTNEEYALFVKRPSLKCVDNVARVLIYNMIKNNPSQDELVVIPQFTASSFEEGEFLKGFGIYQEQSVYIQEDRKYCIWIEEPMLDEEGDYVKEILNVAESFKEAYLEDKVAKYYFFNSEFPSREAYFEVNAALVEKYPGILPLFPLHYGLDQESMSQKYFEDMKHLLGGKDYSTVPFISEVHTFYEKLVNKEPFNNAREWLELRAKEVTKGITNPLLIFPPMKGHVPFDASDKVGTYLYLKYGIPFFNEDKVNNPVLSILNSMTLDPYTNLLSERIQYIKNLPDMCFALPRGSRTKYLVLNLKHTLNLKNGVKFVYVGSSNALENKELDLNEINILSIPEYYGLNAESVVAEENYKSLHKDLMQLQKLMSNNGPILTHTNTILFFHEERLALGYIGTLSASVESVMFPLDEELPFFEDTLNIQDMFRLIPLNMLLNVKDYSEKLSGLLQLFKKTYPGEKPRTKIYVSKDSLNGILLSMSELNNQYRATDINSMSLWCLWSPLAKMQREKFFPVVSDYVELKEFREESMYYTFFGTGYGNLSTVINLSQKFMKGGVGF